MSPRCFFPYQRRRSILISFGKPGKDLQQVLNYRPITLKNCLSKLRERIVNARLTWILEQRNIFATSQYGFRKGRSTTEVFLKMDSVIKHVFINKQHVIANII